MAQCKAKCKATGEQCRRKAVTGSTVCTVHGAGTKVRVEAGIRNRAGAPITNGRSSKYFKEEVLQKIDDFRTDTDLEKLDFEVAYLKTLLPRIEDTNLPEVDKILLLEKTLSSLFSNLDKREKIIEARRYSIGIEKLQLLIKYMFSSVQKHVNDPEILSAIAADLRQISANTGNTNNSDSLQLP